MGILSARMQKLHLFCNRIGIIHSDLLRVLNHHRIVFSIGTKCFETLSSLYRKERLSPLYIEERHCVLSI